MKFSTQEDYGLRCLIRIAQAGSSGSITIPEIAAGEGLSATHVAKLTMILRQNGFIRSSRGQTGGYSLARPATEIRVSEILNALGGRLVDEEFCERHSGQLDACRHHGQCSVRGLWDTIQDAVDRALASLTLADLMPTPAPAPTVTFFASTEARIR